jgi:acyl dehydratase
MIEWFEDIRVGMRFKSPEKLVAREDIKRFAAEFDPQPYHLDEAAAEQSMFRGLAASGWHTAAMAMRLAVETRPFGPHPLLGIGVDDLRWLAPVRPGDVILLTGRYADPKEAVALAQAAEAASFESLWTVEHTIVPSGYASAYPYDASGKMPGGRDDFPLPDPLIWMAFVAAATTRIKFGTGILILPQHNPVLAAKQIATLDHLSHFELA